MQKRVPTIITILWLLASLCVAKVYIYPSSEAPIFSISFPDSWNVETKGEILHANPPDGSIYLGLWALEDAANIEDALASLDTVIAEQVTEVTWGEPEEVEINEIPAITVAGVGDVEGGQEVTVEVAVFSPNGEQEFILLYFGVPEAEEIYDADLSDILQSIVAVEQDMKK